MKYPQNTGYLCDTRAMRKQTVVLLFLLGLSILVFLLHTRLPSRPAAEPLGEPAGLEEVEIPPFYSAFTRDHATGSPAEFQTPPDKLEQSLTLVLPLLFKTTEDGAPIQGESSRNLNIRSDWIAPYLFLDHTLPSLRMGLVTDPATGEIRISGGSLILPGTSLEAGYGIDLNTEEHKATLQWKKSF
jgi:hypothetical protein